MGVVRGQDHNGETSCGKGHEPWYLSSCGDGHYVTDCESQKNLEFHCRRSRAPVEKEE